MKQKVWIALVLMFSINISKAQNFDTRFLRNINSSNTQYDKFWLGVTQSVTPVSIATPISMFAFGYFNQNKDQKRQAFVAGGALALNTAITFSLKYSISRPRPYVADPQIIKKANAGPHSFPSGHTSLAFATATSLTLAYPKWYVALPAYAWASASGYSRMHLGMHYPTDVLAGAIIGTLSGIVAHKINQHMVK